ncbi:MAG: DNA recombination protein RmuC [Candidatus Omnitrophica bacterium]|nr:DNA recombination protein RmuC [Candidatus Omnitrophota bacterium]
MSIPVIILLSVNTLLLIVLLTRELMHQKDPERLERLVREEISNNRIESTKSLGAFSGQLLKLTEMNEGKLERIRDIVETRLRDLQEDNSRKLEKMRETVDEKLHSTLEKRLGESFQIVSERLEKVHAGLGEMQNLASGVGDLKKVLSNVKTRGTLGEVQLETILEQILTSEQYAKNIPTKRGSRDPVEFAIKLPGPDGQGLFIPIDAKFPTQDYERLQDAQEEGNKDLIEQAARALEVRFKTEAKSIKDKYIDPPQTTDFAILFVPMEGLYAEVLRRPGLFNHLRQEFDVVVTGPTNISAYLSSLQMGFRTLAVQKRASEVWQLLGAVRNEFVKFGDILDKTQTRLKQASEEIESAARKSRTIERKLKDVQELPASPALGRQTPASSTGSAGKPDFLEDRSEDVPRQPVDDDTLVA